MSNFHKISSTSGWRIIFLLLRFSLLLEIILVFQLISVDCDLETPEVETSLQETNFGMLILKFSKVKIVTFTTSIKLINFYKLLPVTKTPTV